MRFAFTIGSYRLCDFIRLNIRQIQEIFPDSPILVSDDASPESHIIERIAKDCGVNYIGTKGKRGHFGGDVQALLNCLAFGEAAKSDVYVKVSQRFVFRKPECRAILEDYFSKFDFASPGQPKKIHGMTMTHGFGAFAVLSDLVVFKAGTLGPHELMEIYRNRINNEQVPWKDFVESLIHALHLYRYKDRSVMMPEFTDSSKEDPLYLRRYQSSEREYQSLASQRGIAGRFPLAEWAVLDGRSYVVNPTLG